MGKPSSAHSGGPSHPTHLVELVVAAHGRADRGLAEHAHQVSVGRRPVGRGEPDIVYEPLVAQKGVEEGERMEEEGS